jgi:hypothetical protein
MRWNNLGIGYLDQLQYILDSIDAFEQVTRCVRITRTATSTLA